MDGVTLIIIIIFIFAIVLGWTATLVTLMGNDVQDTKFAVQELLEIARREEAARRT